MADSTVSRRATIEVPVNADVEKLKNASKELENLHTHASSIKDVLDKANTSFKNFNKTLDSSSKDMHSFFTSLGNNATSAKNKMSSFSKDTANSLDSVKKSLSSASRSSTSLTKKIGKSGTALDEHQKKLQAYATDYEKQMASIKRTNDLTSENFKKYKDTVEDGNKAMRESARQTSRTKAVPDTKGVTRYNGEIKKATDVSEKFSHTGWSMLGVTGALGASFIKGAKDAAYIQQQMRMVTNLSVTSGEKRAEVLRNVGKMTKENTDLSVKYGISQTDLAQGDEQLVHAGYSTNAALAVHKTLVQGAIASNQSYGDVMNQVTTTLDKYGMRSKNVATMTKNTSTIMNEMAYGVDHGKASFNDFGTTLRYAGETAHSAGQKLSGVMSAITELSLRGLEGSEAGTGLRKVLNSFMAPNTGLMSQQGPAMAKLGLSPKDFRDAHGRLYQLGHLMDILKAKMSEHHYNKGQKDQFIHNFFGSTGQEAAFALLKAGKSIKYMNTQIEKSSHMKGSSYVQWLAKNNMKTATNQVNVFKQAWNAFGIATANTILPSLTGLVKGLDKVLLWVNKFSPGGKKFVAFSAVAVAAISPITFILGSFKKTIDITTGAYTKFVNLFKEPISNRMKQSVDKTTESIDNDSSKIQESTDKIQSSEGNPLSTDTTPLSRVERSSQLSKVSGMTKFKSRFGGVGTTGTKLGQVADDEHLLATVGKDAGKVSFLSKGAGMLSKVGGGLAIGTSLLGLLGMNGHNAGSKIGDTGGTIAGGLLGSLLDPFTFGMGTVAGSWAGGKIGDWLGKGYDKMNNPTEKKSTKKASNASNKIQQLNYDKMRIKDYAKGSSEYIKYANEIKRINKQMYSSNVKQANASYKKQTRDLKQALKMHIISQSEYTKKLKQAEQTRVKDSKKSQSSIYKAYSKLYNNLGKLSQRQAVFVVQKSIKTRNQQIKDAEKVHTEAVKKANEEYNTKVGYLKEFHKQNTAQGKALKAVYKSERDDAITNADNAKRVRINDANKASQKVIDADNRQHKHLNKVVDEETGRVHKWYDGIVSFFYNINTLGGRFTPSKANNTTKFKFANGTNTQYPNGLPHNTNAVVNDGSGPELISFGGNWGMYRGRNIHTILPKGSKVYNAQETKKMVGVQYFANGTNSAPMPNAKFHDLSATVAKSYSKTNKQTKKQLAEFQKTNSDTWNGVGKDTKSSTSKLTNTSEKQYSTLFAALQKQQSDMHDSSNKETTNMVNDFGKILQSLPKFAKAAMQSTVSALNQGIQGIDSALQEFGGNSQVLKPFHYAAGSNGKLPNDQFAMVNDAKSGPKQEAIVRDGNLMFPKYENQLMHLQKGDQVLNGRQTEKIIGINHYAKGSGVSDSELEKIAARNAKAPSKFFSNDFVDKVKSTGTSLQKALTTGLANAIKPVGTKWSQAMWSVINNTIGGGGASGSKGAFLKYAEKIATGRPYVYGGFDCSKMIQDALAHMGIQIGRDTVSQSHSSQLRYLGKSLSNVEPGDLAYFGSSGENAHVGIVSNVQKRLMMNQHPPKGGISSIDCGDPLDGYYAVKGLHSDSGGKDKDNSGLDKLVKSELGKHALKWISSHLGDSGAGKGPVPTGSHKHWLEEAGIPTSDYSAANYIITRESGWNPHATNSSTGAYGLPQSLPASKMASAGSDYRDNPITQLKWMKGYVRRYGGFPQAQAYWEVHKNYANGGWATQPSTFGEVPGEPEIAINPRRNSADSLISQAITARDKVKGNPLKSIIKSRNLQESGKSIIKKIGQLLAKKNHDKPQLIFSPTINMTFNGKVERNEESRFRRIVREELQRLAQSSMNKLDLNI